MVTDTIVSLVGNNTCFYGKCYYCRETEPACAEGDVMEGSVTLWLPDVWPLQKHRHPWGRTYREGKLARYSNYVFHWFSPLTFFSRLTRMSVQVHTTMFIKQFQPDGLWLGCL